MKIVDYALKCEDGWMDIDVYDTEIDMAVAFVWSVRHEDKDEYDEYDRFLTILADNVEIDKFVSDWLVCDFSGYFRNFNSELEKLNKDNGWGTIEFDGDETYYDYVLWLESLISGNESESTYKKINDVLTGTR